MPRILIMAGEASGDQHGAKLARALKTLDPGVDLIGLGGPKMEAVGVELLQGIDKLDIIGVPTIAELRQAYRTFHALSARLREMPLDAVVLIDNPGLNLRLARVAKKAGHRVIYFIAPQIWAWNRTRIEIIKKYVDLVLVILPFEERFYQDAGVKVAFVGHPMLDELAAGYDKAALRSSLGVTEPARLIGLLPGSRKGEVTRILPIMLQAAEHLERNPPADGVPYRFVLGQAASVPDALIDQIAGQSPVRLLRARDRAYDVMASADMLITASGTATLQSAIFGNPMIVVYKTSLLTAWLARTVVKVPYLGLANLVAGRLIAPEILQDDLTKERLIAEVTRVFTDPKASADAKAASLEIRGKLGQPGASKRAAEAILAACAAAT